MTSAYPAPLDTLIPQAQQWATELGEIPSRNKIMGQFRIGAKKAAQVRAALTEPVPDTDATSRRLHAVPNTTSADDTVTEPTRTVASQSDAVTEPGRPGSVTGEAARGASITDLPARGASVTTEQVSAPVDPATPSTPTGQRAGRPWTRRVPTSWPLILLALPAFVAIWSGWVGLGELTGFGPVHPLPGIASGFTLNTAITLPIGVETYAAYALRVWLAGIGSSLARRFAKYSAIGSLVLGAAGQVAYHLMTASHVTAAPWPITTAVACLPVVVLGFGAALAHLQHHTTDHPTEDEEVSR